MSRTTDGSDCPLCTHCKVPLNTASLPIEARINSPPPESARTVAFRPPVGHSSRRKIEDISLSGSNRQSIMQEIRDTVPVPPNCLCDRVERLRGIFETDPVRFLPHRSRQANPVARIPKPALLFAGKIDDLKPVLRIKQHQCLIRCSLRNLLAATAFSRHAS